MAEMDDKVQDWELGLPGPEELMPLSQMLITPELASAFSISPEPCRTLVDVGRASSSTISCLRRHNSAPEGGTTSSTYSRPGRTASADFDAVLPTQNENSGREGDDGTQHKSSGGDTNKESPSVGTAAAEEADSSGFDEDAAARTLKRPRLVWTPQLHKRFVDVVTHLGIKNAVPKTIMQLMNVEGLTRENVASHLQKYRLYLKRMQGHGGSEGPCPSSDLLFASTPLPNAMAAAARDHHHPHPQLMMPVAMPMQVPYGPGPHMVPVPVMGMGPPPPLPVLAHAAPAPAPPGAPAPASAASFSGYDPHAYGAASSSYSMSVAWNSHSVDADRMETSSNFKGAATAAND